MGLNIPPRLPQWRRYLTQYLSEVSQTKFDFGSHDCALFCAGAVRSMTGFDAAEGWRGYATLREGKELLRDAGVTDWWDLIADRECAPMAVGIGDIALVMSGGELAGGVCLGRSVCVLGADSTGLVRHSQIERGYKI